MSDINTSTTDVTTEEELVETTVLQTSAPTPTPLTRDEIRAKVLGAKPKTVLVEDFFGTSVELRQPELGVVLNMRKAEEDHQISRMLIDYTFVPKTMERVFEEADAEAILSVPFGEEMKRYIDCMNSLLGQEVKKVEAIITDATKSD